MHHATGERPSARPKFPWLPIIGTVFSGSAAAYYVGRAIDSSDPTQLIYAGCHGIALSLWVVGLRLNLRTARMRRTMHQGHAVLAAHAKAQALMGIAIDRMDPSHPRHALTDEAFTRGFAAMGEAEILHREYRAQRGQA